MRESKRSAAGQRSVRSRRGFAGADLPALEWRRWSDGGGLLARVHLEVVDEIDLDLGVALDLGHDLDLWVDAVDDLAVDNAAREVLDLLEVALEVALDPRSELLAANEIALQKAHSAQRAQSHAQRRAPRDDDAAPRQPSATQAAAASCSVEGCGDAHRRRVGPPQPWMAAAAGLWVSAGSTAGGRERTSCIMPIAAMLATELRGGLIGLSRLASDLSLLFVHVPGKKDLGLRSSHERYYLRAVEPFQLRASARK